MTIQINEVKVKTIKLNHSSREKLVTDPLNTMLNITITAMTGFYVMF